MSPRMADILRAVAELGDVSVAQLASPQRARGLTEVRHIAVWCLWRITRRSATEIGRVLQRDHSTVLHALRRAPELMAQRADLAALAAAVAARFPDQADPDPPAADWARQIAALQARVELLEADLLAMQSQAAPLPAPPPPPPSPPPSPPIAPAVVPPAPPPATVPAPKLSRPPVRRPPPLTPAEALEQARRQLDQQLYSPGERAARIAYTRAAEKAAAHQTGA